jgi:hypothetical protein
MAEGLTRFTHSLAPHGGKGGERASLALYRRKDMTRGQGPGEGKGTVAHGEIPGRKGRKGLKWKTRLGMEKGYVKEECPLGGQEGIKHGERC